MKTVTEITNSDNVSLKDIALQILHLQNKHDLYEEESNFFFNLMKMNKGVVETFVESDKNPSVEKECRFYKNLHELNMSSIANFFESREKKSRDSIQSLVKVMEEKNDEHEESD
jgi:hypothetical protein